MASKKKEETVDETQTDAVEAKTEETVEAAAAEGTEPKPKKTAKAKAAVEKDEKPAKAKTKSAAPKKAKPVKAEADGNNAEGKTSGKRAEKIGIVFSDKMTKTVVVRVERVVKHPLYHKYMKRRKKFMAHDELGAGMGDRVRIVETRPLSARKRWRVVEIIQKAER
ncbi:MAG: 30S ribosomal protein S17 [Acidobacteria bacterium]|nr:30S ribosomal protein S17 [Acidobacteriota bacterium]